MGIEEFTDVFRKSTEYDEIDHKFKLVCNKGIQEVLHYITKFGLNNTAITEQQALSKIAERFPMTTDQIVSVLERAQIPTQQQQFCAPHSCRSQIVIEELIEKIDKEMFAYPAMEPECGKDPNEEFKGGYNKASEVIIGYLKDLPTQPELVEVPKVTGVMIDYFKREGFSLHESLNLHGNVPNTLSLVYKEFREWLTLDDYATKEDIFARAWLDGYTAKKEQLYWAVIGVTDYFKCDGKIIVFTKEEEAVEVANLIGINTRAEQLEWHEHSDCILIDELRATM